jgi:hypothetical protein
LQARFLKRLDKPNMERKSSILRLLKMLLLRQRQTTNKLKE